MVVIVVGMMWMFKYLTEDKGFIYAFIPPDWAIGSVTT